MINIQQFKDMQKNSSRSYHQQKNLIKKLMLGKTVNCAVCGEKLTLHLPETHEVAGIFCRRGCTEIHLAME